MTVSDLCTKALRRLGAIARGNTPTAQSLNDALSALNIMRDGWAIERLMVYAEVRTTWTIVANTRDYLVGTGQAVNVARPNYVSQIADTSPIRLLNNNLSPALETPLELMTDAQWRGLPQKTLTSTYPTSAYYNPTFPYGTISLYPTPTGSSLQGVLYAPTAVSTLALADTLSVPAGWALALRDNLALAMAPDWNVTPSPELRQSAMESKANIKRANTRLVDLSMDPMWASLGGWGGYDINTDQVR